MMSPVGLHSPLLNPKAEFFWQSPSWVRFCLFGFFLFLTGYEKQAVGLTEKPRTLHTHRVTTCQSQGSHAYSPLIF